MASLRFTFPFFHSPHGPKAPHIPRPIIVTAVGTGLAVVLAAANWAHPIRPSPHARHDSPVWAAMSLAGGVSVEPKTGVEFPATVDGGRQLLGIGLRRKCLFGLKNIDVYAFGIYVDDKDVKKLREKYGTLSASELRENKEFYMDVLEEDIRMTIRLQIVYGRLSIRSIQNAFEESVGNRLQKFSQADNKELLQRFTSIFRDEYKIPRGCSIDLSREPEHNLVMKIDGKEVGSIQSNLLCKSILDLYIGDDSFDKKAKEDYDSGLSSLLQD